MNKKKLQLEGLLEEGAKIFLENIVNFGLYTVLTELLSREVITASSVIFLKEDVKECLKDELLNFFSQNSNKKETLRLHSLKRG